ncbi:hypothetical protein FKM82_018637 [Ascaphus truei]
MACVLVPPSAGRPPPSYRCLQTLSADHSHGSRRAVEGEPLAPASWASLCRRPCPSGLVHRWAQRSFVSLPPWLRTSSLGCGCDGSGGPHPSPSWRSQAWGFWPPAPSQSRVGSVAH